MMIWGFVSELGRRLAIGTAALSLVTGVMAWSATQSAYGVALASSCSSHSEGTCESKADRVEDAAEATNEKQCRTEHTEKFCRDRDRAEDCAEKGNRGEDLDCEPYGAQGESGDNHLHITQLDAATKALSNAGVDFGVVGTATAILVVLTTLLLVAVRRLRLGRL